MSEHSMCPQCERNLDEQPHHQHCPVLWQQTKDKCEQLGLPFPAKYYTEPRPFPRPQDP